MGSAACSVAIAAATVVETALGVSTRRLDAIMGVVDDPARIRRRRVEWLAVMVILTIALVLAATMPAPEAGLYALILFTGLDPICRRIAPIPPRPGTETEAA